MLRETSRHRAFAVSSFVRAGLLLRTCASRGAIVQESGIARIDVGKHPHQGVLPNRFSIVRIFSHLKNAEKILATKIPNWHRLRNEGCVVVTVATA
jgi:hypothetical protein